MSRLEELQMAEHFTFGKATPRAIVESLPVRTITEEQIMQNIADAAD